MRRCQRYQRITIYRRMNYLLTSCSSVERGRKSKSCLFFASPSILPPITPLNRLNLSPAVREHHPEQLPTSLFGLVNLRCCEISHLMYCLVIEGFGSRQAITLSPAPSMLTRSIARLPNKHHCLEEPLH